MAEIDNPDGMFSWARTLMEDLPRFLANRGHAEIALDALGPDTHKCVLKTAFVFGIRHAGVSALLHATRAPTSRPRPGAMAVYLAMPPELRRHARALEFRAQRLLVNPRDVGAGSTWWEGGHRRVYRPEPGVAPKAAGSTDGVAASEAAGVHGPAWSRPRRALWVRHRWPGMRHLSSKRADDLAHQ